MTRVNHTPRPGRVAVSHDGEIIVHAEPSNAGGDYDTLCGLDTDDPAIGLEPAAVPRNGRARIDCEDCKSIWETARQYSARDFK